MLPLVKQLIFVLLVLTGAVAGVLFAIFGTYYACVFLDFLFGQIDSGGFIAVGWLFFIITVPVGGYVGGHLSQALAQKLLGIASNDSTGEHKT